MGNTDALSRALQHVISMRTNLVVVEDGQLEEGLAVAALGDLALAVVEPGAAGRQHACQVRRALEDLVVHRGGGTPGAEATLPRLGEAQQPCTRIVRGSGF